MFFFFTVQNNRLSNIDSRIIPTLLRRITNEILEVKGEYRCYKDGFLTETECQEHYSLTVNASSDIIIAMRNISDPYFGRYLISVYRGPDDKIDTWWIIVSKKGKLSTFPRTLEYVIWAVSRGCNRRLTYILFLQNFYCEIGAQLQWLQRYPCHMCHIHIQKITSPPRRIGPVNSLRVTVQWKTTLVGPVSLLPVGILISIKDSSLKNGLYCYPEVLSKCIPRLS